MSIAKFETVVEYRRDRLARERKTWIADAVWYMLDIGLYTQDEINDAYYLADNLVDGYEDFTPKEAVDEELTYWGD